MKKNKQAFNIILIIFTSLVFLAAVALSVVLTRQSFGVFQNVSYKVVSLFIILILLSNSTVKILLFLLKKYER